MLPKEERGAKGKAAGVKDNVRSGPSAWAGKAVFAGLRKSRRHGEVSARMLGI